MISHSMYGKKSAEYVEATAHQQNANAVLCFALAPTSTPIAWLLILGKRFAARSDSSGLKALIQQR